MGLRKPGARGTMTWSAAASGATRAAMYGNRGRPSLDNWQCPRVGRGLKTIGGYKRAFRNSIAMLVEMDWGWQLPLLCKEWSLLVLILPPGSGSMHEPVGLGRPCYISALFLPIHIFLIFLDHLFSLEMPPKVLSIRIYYLVLPPPESFSNNKLS